MNRLKPVFISMYMMTAMAIMVYAIWSIWKGGEVVAWGGVLLTTAPFMLLVQWLMLFNPMARTSARFPLLTLLGIVGAGLSIYGWQSMNAAALAPLLAFVGLILFLVYAYWYSSFGRSESEVIAVGKKLPDFEARDMDGRVVHSTSLTDGRPAIFIFFRGNWCPLCMAQIKELAGLYQQIRELGIRVILVSPQPHDNTKKLAEKFSVDFDFLVDENNSAARTLGIENRNGLPMGMEIMGYKSATVLPTVVITDKDGNVVWNHQTDNYRVRPEPDIYLSVMKENGVITMAAR